MRIDFENFNDYLRTKNTVSYVKETLAIGSLQLARRNKTISFLDVRERPGESFRHRSWQQRRRKMVRDRPTVGCFRVISCGFLPLDLTSYSLAA
ncbi:hypothetical protein V1477_010082 [Vespula maculifrons]|uniref:Uncharacterized protein n=1 Tax=Vespula maculifrons TaxID=7453 RepID=A0ABD2CBL6_VESMC